MVTATAPRRPHAPSVDRPLRSRGDGAPPELGSAARRVRLPELAVGMLVTVLFALGAVLWHLNATAKVPALAVSGDVGRGALIEQADLHVVYVASDDAIATLSEASAASVVGRAALVDLPAGTLLSEALIADATTLGAGDGVVGLALEPGQYPSLGIAPGDRVTVVLASDAAPGAGEAGSAVVARDATVFDVEDLASSRKLVSILASESDAEAVAAAASAGGLRLVQVAP